MMGGYGYGFFSPNTPQLWSFTSGGISLVASTQPGTGVFEPWLQELWKQPRAQVGFGEQLMVTNR